MFSNDTTIVLTRRYYSQTWVKLLLLVAIISRKMFPKFCVIKTILYLMIENNKDGGNVRSSRGFFSRYFISYNTRQFVQLISPILQSHAGLRCTNMFFCVLYPI